MFQYKISVSANGVFLFRTEADHDFARVRNAAVALKSSAPLLTVSVERTNATIHVGVVGDDLTFTFGE